MGFGPKKIIEVKSGSEHLTDLNPSAVYSFQGKLWEPIENGCILCSDEDKEPGKFSVQAQDDGTVHCLVHGEVEGLAYRAERGYVIKLGDKEIKGLKIYETTVYIPKSFVGQEREDLVTLLVRQGEKAERDELDDECEGGCDSCGNGA